MILYIIRLHRYTSVIIYYIIKLHIQWYILQCTIILQRYNHLIISADGVVTGNFLLLLKNAVQYILVVLIIWNSIFANMHIPSYPIVL